MKLMKLTSIGIVGVPLILGTTINSVKDQKKILSNYEYTAKLAKNNKDINEWIKRITKKQTHSYKNDLKELYELPISNNLKSFMKSNLDDKYKTFNQQTKMSSYSTTQTRLANYQNKYIINEQGDKILSKIDNKPILMNGTDWQTVHDYWFADDVSYIRWSNQTAYNNMAKTLDPKIIAKMKSNADWFTRFFTQDKNQIISTLAGVALGKAASVMSKKIIKNIKNGVTLAQDIAIKMGVGTVVKETPIVIISSINKQREELIKNIEDSAISSVITAISVAVPLFGKALDLIWTLAHVIGPGNGASFIENWNDHGLNDWKYQIKHNFINMAKTAHNFSNNYKEGIMWKITDGWFSLPEIWVGSQKSGTPWKFISPGSSFNFGHKLDVWYP